MSILSYLNEKYYFCYNLKMKFTLLNIFTILYVMYLKTLFASLYLYTLYRAVLYICLSAIFLFILYLLLVFLKYIASNVLKYFAIIFPRTKFLQHLSIEGKK